MEEERKQELENGPEHEPENEPKNEPENKPENKPKDETTETGTGTVNNKNNTRVDNPKQKETPAGDVDVKGVIMVSSINFIQATDFNGILRTRSLLPDMSRMLQLV